MSKTLHFCSLHQPVVDKFVALRDRLDVSDPESYYNHTLMLALVGLTHNEISQFSVSKGWVNVKLYQDDKYIKWILTDSLKLPRVVKIALLCKIEIIEFFILLPSNQEILNYLLTSFVDELKEFIENSKASVFLKSFMLYYVSNVFEETSILAKQYYYILKIEQLFLIKNPIFIFNYKSHYLSLIGRNLDFDKLADAVQIPSDDVHLCNEHERKRPYMQTSYEFMNQVLGLEGDSRLHFDLPSKEIIDTEYHLDRHFFELLVYQTSMVKNMSTIDYLLYTATTAWFYEEDRTEWYNRMLVFLRTHNFQFEGDDPLNIRHLFPEWQGLGTGEGFSDRWRTQPRKIEP